MKILIAHNFYKHAGGEDAVMENEIDFLQINGNHIIRYELDNKSINSFASKIFTFLNVPFSVAQYKKFQSVLKIEKPEVVHVHNYFPRLSPSIFYACKMAHVPVVHTLHNYRAVCPTALLMYNGRVDERSLNGSSWWTISNKVYKGSWLGTFALVLMVELHKKVGTWQTKVDRYIALTEFAKDKYLAAGWPNGKVIVKPNSIADPFDGAIEVEKKGGYSLYVGRLSEEKGIDFLLDAWRDINGKLKIIGDGPLSSDVALSATSNIQFFGRKQKDEVLELIKNAEFVLMPSSWYEGFPMVLVEAFACGTPALVSRLGSMKEIVSDGVTGLHFKAGSREDFVEKVRWMIENPERAREMGNNARGEYLAKYTQGRNYELLMGIYRQTIDSNTNSFGGD